jgi:hypothetical protein
MDEERAATQEKMKELYDMVHGLQEELDGGATMDEEHTLPFEHGSIIVPSKARTQNKSLENQSDEYKKKFDKFETEKDGMGEAENEKSDTTFPGEGWRVVFKKRWMEVPSWTS